MWSSPARLAEANGSPNSAPPPLRRARPHLPLRRDVEGARVGEDQGQAHERREIAKQTHLHAERNPAQRAAGSRHPHLLARPVRGGDLPVERAAVAHPLVRELYAQVEAVGAVVGVEHVGVGDRLVHQRQLLVVDVSCADAGLAKRAP